MIGRIAIALAAATAVALAAPAGTPAPGAGSPAPGAGSSTAPAAGSSSAPGAGSSTAPGAGSSSAPAARVHGGLVDAMDCSACHTPAGWSLGGGAGRGFDHDRTGFALRGAHAQQACAGCHQGQGAPPSTCEGCHADPHQRRVPGACVECHTATAWSDTDVRMRHRRTRMPLDGRHADLDCVACHTRGERTQTAVPTACYACHAADYHDPATHPDHDGDPADPTRARFSRACGTCHRTSGWEPATFDPTVFAALEAPAAEARHDRVFTLSTGPHQGAPCASCHTGGARTRRVRCDGCHPREALRAQHPPSALASRRSAACLGCHPRGQAR